MDKLKCMTAFCQVAELSSFAGAADRLDLSGPMVSKQVAQLEQYLGLRLLNRTTRKVSLTETGRQYYARCKQLISDLTETEDLARAIEHQPKGLLKINAPIDFGMMHMAAVVGSYKKAFPEVNVQLILDNKYVDLNDGLFDIVIRITDQPDNDAVGKVIQTTELCCYASAGYLDKHGEPRTIKDLQNHHCLQFLGTPQEDDWIFRTENRIQIIQPRWHFASNNGNVLCQAAERGMGVIQVPDITASPYLSSGSLKPVLAPYRVRSLPIYAMYLSRRFQPARIKSFTRFLASNLAQPNNSSGQP